MTEARGIEPLAVLRFVQQHREPDRSIRLVLIEVVPDQVREPSPDAEHAERAGADAVLLLSHAGVRTDPLAKAGDRLTERAHLLRRPVGAQPPDPLDEILLEASVVADRTRQSLCGFRCRLPRQGLFEDRVDLGPCRLTDLTGLDAFVEPDHPVALPAASPG